MIIGYCRVSTIGQADKGTSLETQKEQILAKYPDAKIVEEAYSGAKKRPLFTQVIEELSNGDMLVTTKLDRFCRTTKEGLEYIDMLMNKGVSIHILNMGLIENNPIGRLMITNLLAFAEFERAIIKERMTSGKEFKRANDPNYKEGRPNLEIEKFPKKEKGQSVSEYCRDAGLSRSSYYKYVKSGLIS